MIVIHIIYPSKPENLEALNKATQVWTLKAACVDLGLINEALGLDPNDGGAEPILDAIAELKQPPAPDCRTCVNASVCHFHFNAPVCTNGDQYQPAPEVVLWRTE